MANNFQSGFVFPMIAQGPQGRVNYVRNDSKRLIKDSVKQIILTTPGERMWNPTFGCRIRELLFQPSSPVFAAMVQNLITAALTKWEPRITVKASDITVTFANDNSGGMVVRIKYSINNPDATGNSVGSAVTDAVSIPFLVNGQPAGNRFAINGQIIGSQFSVNG